ncbi:MAG: TldD protein [Clostridiales bacterium]|nr:TldD protein [Clostridiales bacterium]
MLDRLLIEEILLAALSKGGDFSEIFIEDRTNTSIEMIKGKVENALSGRDFGIGIRVFSGLNSVYVYTSRTDRAGLLDLAKTASAAVGEMKKSEGIEHVMGGAVITHPIRLDPSKITASEKVALLRRGYESAKAYSEQVTQITGHYLDYTQRVLIANSEGLMAEDTRTRTRYTVSTVAEAEGQMQSGSANRGASRGFELYDDVSVEALGREAARIAVVMLEAKPAPSGKFPVVLDNKFGGVIFHEACGHSLEATSVAKGLSEFSGKLGTQIASSIVSAVDDGTVPGAWGSEAYDDEGTPARRNVLIENGILKGYMIDRLNARRMKMDITGSARRQSYHVAPTSRMTNTYILNGTSRFEDMIGSIEHGLYAKTLGGGSVNPTTGEFNFAVKEGYLIENGKIKDPVKGATLIGTGAEILKKIEMIGDNFDSAEGMCGSISGSIPVGLGQPALKVADITVGGRKEA